MLASTLEDLKAKQIPIYSTVHNSGLFKVNVVFIAVNQLTMMILKLYSVFQKPKAYGQMVSYFLKKEKKKLFHIGRLGDMATGMPSVVEKLSSSENITIHYKALG